MTPDEGGSPLGALIGALVIVAAIGGPGLLRYGWCRLRAAHRRGLARVHAASRGRNPRGYPTRPHRPI